MQRRLIGRWIILAGMVLGAGVAWPLHAGAQPLASHKTYSSTTFGYTINYPGNWSRTPLKGIQFAAFSPDHNAFITANAVHGTASLAQIKTAQKNALSNLGKVQGKITYALKSIHGLDFQTAEAVVKNSAGHSLDTILLDTVRHGSLYDFDAGVVEGTSLTNNETVALQNSLNSIQIH